MTRRGFRISDGLVMIALLALAFSVARRPSLRADPTWILGPAVVSTALATFGLAALAARFGDPRRKPFRWGLAASGALCYAVNVLPGFDGDYRQALWSTWLADMASQPITSVLMGIPRSSAQWAFLS